MLSGRVVGDNSGSKKALLGVCVCVGGCCWGMDEERHMKLTDAAGTQNCHCVAGKGSEMPSILCRFSNGALFKVIL